MKLEPTLCTSPSPPLNRPRRSRRHLATRTCIRQQGTDTSHIPSHSRNQCQLFGPIPSVDIFVLVPNTAQVSAPCPTSQLLSLRTHRISSSIYCCCNSCTTSSEGLGSRFTLIGDPTNVAVSLWFQSPGASRNGFTHRQQQ
jgi:hypothetical protein